MAVAGDAFDSEKSHITILLAYMSQDEAIKLAEEVKSISIIVVAHEGKTTLDPIKTGETLILQAGAKGTHIGHLRVTADERRRIVNYHNEIVRLGEQIDDDSEILKLLDE